MSCRLAKHPAKKKAVQPWDCLTYTCQHTLLRCWLGSRQFGQHLVKRRLMPLGRSMCVKGRYTNVVTASDLKSAKGRGPLVWRKVRTNPTTDAKGAISIRRATNPCPSSQNRMSKQEFLRPGFVCIRDPCMSTPPELASEAAFKMASSAVALVPAIPPVLSIVSVRSNTMQPATCYLVEMTV